MKKTYLGLITFLLTTLATACPITPSELEKLMRTALNNKSVSASMNVPYDNLTEIEFDSIVSRIRDHFTPIFLAQGKTLNVFSSWTFPMSNAFATKDALGSNLYFFGLFTKNRYMTKDGFLFVGCHEAGHHLGGFPKNQGSNSWSSVEGEADYYAASKCYREILKGDPLNAEAEKLELPEPVKALCKTRYEVEDEYRICLRAARAAEDVALVLDYINTSTEKTEMFLNQPEAPVTDKTLTSHPTPVCRTQTILQASLCHIESDVDISDTDETIGACSEKSGDKVGNRARCWFKPKDESIK